MLQAVGLLQGYEPVMSKLGRPIKMHNLSTNPAENKVDPVAGEAKVTLSGFF